MNKVVLAGLAALAIAGSSMVYAQNRPWFHQHMQFTPEDRAAFADARIAAVHAGLKLSPDQEKLWPPVEAAVRDLVKLKIDRANARMKAREAAKDDDKPVDPVARLRDRAERMAAKAVVLKKIAETADPLYKTLDDAQKRRLAVLTHRGHHGWRHRGMDRGDDRDGGQGMDRGGPSGPQRL
jgi:ADP-ribose pyrophosphatase YjhB (NUDIX family)